MQINVTLSSLISLTSLKLITRRGSLRTWCTAGVSSAGQSSRTSSQPYEGEHQSQLNIYVCQQKTLSLLRSFYSEIQYITCYITIITELNFILMFVRNNCTYCGGDLEDNYPPAALCLALVLFPVGIVCCLLLKERQCVLCNRTSSAWIFNKTKYFRLPLRLSFEVSLEKAKRDLSQKDEDSELWTNYGRRIPLFELLTEPTNCIHFCAPQSKKIIL